MLLSSLALRNIVTKQTSFKATGKAVGLSLTIAAVGLGLFSVLRYSAKASEFLGISAESVAVEDSFMSAIEDDGLYRLSMNVVGAASEYEIFEVEIAARGLDAQATLRIKARAGELQEYEKALDEATFRQFWRSVRELEVAQLSDLSPHTEAFARRIDAEANKRYQTGDKARSETEDALSQQAYDVPKVESSATYRFTFQDGLYDYPNSFEVYAPDALEDARYRDLRDVTKQFVDEVFGTSVAAL